MRAATKAVVSIYTAIARGLGGFEVTMQHDIQAEDGAGRRVGGNKRTVRLVEAWVTRAKT